MTAPTETRVSSEELSGRLAELAAEFDVPGAAVGVLFNGEEQYATFGVTSIENPLPVDENTLFQFGSTGKTFTATAIMRLVEQGKIDLTAPVRTYVPELALKDEQAAANVTVLQLLNHTAGWQGDFFEDTGRGDDAVALYVEKMAGLDQVTPLGTQASYNNASLVLAGRVIEKVTGQQYEEALTDLLLKPLGLKNTLANLNEIMTRRFVVGHTKDAEGNLKVAHPWAMPRAVVPAGGWAAGIRDQIAWARFHLGDGTAPDGQRVLSQETLDRMKEPTFDMGRSAIGDAVAVSWLIKDVDGTRLVGHGGSTNGQLSAFQTVPARNFAVAVLTNAAPNGSQLHGAMVKWALERYLGVVEPEEEQLSLSADDLAAYAGRYETIVSYLTLSVDGDRLSAQGEPKPEVLERLRAVSDEEPNQQPPIPIALTANDGFVVPEGPAKGMRGYFTRDEAGNVSGVHLGGRLATRVPPGE